jgi:hypothetical protein
MISIRRYSNFFLTPLLVLASCSSGPTEDPASSTAEALSANAATQATSSASPAPAHKEWHRAMSKTRSSSKDGCFQATYPSTTWVEVPCTKAPDYPLIPAQGGARAAGAPETVGNNSGDSTSIASGTISWSEGSFPSVIGVNSEKANGVANTYSLQLNTNKFNTSACNGHSGCQGWEQFVFEGTGGGFIQYWLIGYGGTCPSGWTNNGAPAGDCYRNSGTSAPVPAQAITNLANLSVLGSAGSSDMLTIAVGNVVYMISQASVLGLNAGGWTTSEFNVFGDSGGDQAVFQDPGTTIVVQTLTESVTPTENAPQCGTSSFTGETNNLTLVPGSCCAIGGVSPGIQFEESNGSPAAQSCQLVALPDPAWSSVGHPFDAVRTGTDTDGATFFSCRANYQGSLQVGKTRGSWQSCDISFGGQEVFLKPYESLVGPWTDGSGDTMSSNALAFGTDGSGGPPLYPCRAYLNGNGYQLGKVRPGLGGCYIPYGGSEQIATRYQVLTGELALVTQGFSNATPPSNALVGGYDTDNAPFYVCQAVFNGGYVPGKTRSSWHSCDVSWGGSEHFVSSYNVLVPFFKAAPGTIFQAGLDTNGSPLGICHASYQNSQQVGKYLSYGACNFGFGGHEVSLNSGYQVLSF